MKNAPKIVIRKSERKSLLEREYVDGRIITPGVTSMYLASRLGDVVVSVLATGPKG
jgi:hypothetical protein